MVSDPTELEIKLQQLEKENRILQKKLERSNATCIQLEAAIQKKESLLRQAITELKESQSVLEQRVLERTNELQTAKENIELTLQELQLAQTHLVQAEKMSGLGQLVAGVAHEINNPVNFIHGNLSFVQEYVYTLLSVIHLYQEVYFDPVPQMQAKLKTLDIEFIQADLPKILNSMKVGTDRIRQIVLSLRNFSRLDEADFKAVDIHEGLDSTLLILQYRFKDRSKRPGIQILRNYGNLPPVECYPGQLNQVFMNILANAIDALEESAGEQAYKENQAKPGQIIIQTSLVDANWVKIAIADNGIGMTETVRQQIFNPFFTTKPVGKGTGMGMSISHQIVTEKHGGTLECFSTLGKGTEFIIQIPVNH